LEAGFILLEFPSPSRRIFIGSHSLPPLWFAVSVLQQVNKEWDCVKDTMDDYCIEIYKLEGQFEGIEFPHVPRNNNTAVDVLSILGSRRALVPAGVFVQDLRKPSIKLLDPDSPEPPQHD
jgi:hypothetical protein